MSTVLVGKNVSKLQFSSIEFGSAKLAEIIISILNGVFRFEAL